MLSGDGIAATSPGGTGNLRRKFSGRIASQAPLSGVADRLKRLPPPKHILRRDSAGKFKASSDIARTGAKFAPAGSGENLHAEAVDVNEDRGTNKDEEDSHSESEAESANSPAVSDAPTVSRTQYSKYDAGSSHELVRRQIVFDYEDRRAGFTRLLAGDSLAFYSHFESGNLMRVERVPVRRRDGGCSCGCGGGQVQMYNLCLSPDVHTAGSVQWFFFRVSNVIPGVRYRFTIGNFTKRTSQFSKGQRPVVFSLLQNTIRIRQQQQQQQQRRRHDHNQQQQEPQQQQSQRESQHQQRAGLCQPAHTSSSNSTTPEFDTSRLPANGWIHVGEEMQYGLMRELLKSPGARDADAADTATADKAFFKVCDAQYVKMRTSHEQRHRRQSQQQRRNERKQALTLQHLHALTEARSPAPYDEHMRTASSESSFVGNQPAPSPRSPGSPQTPRLVPDNIEAASMRISPLELGSASSLPRTGVGVPVSRDNGIVNTAGVERTNLSAQTLEQGAAGDDSQGERIASATHFSAPGSATEFGERIGETSTTSQSRSWPQVSPSSGVEKMYHRKGRRPIYLLRFDVDFASSLGDSLLMSFCPPYTYSRLRTFLQTFQSNQHVRVEPLCSTLAGNTCHVVTVAKNCDAARDTAFQGGGEVSTKALSNPPSRGKNVRANSPIFGSSRPLSSFASVGRSQSENLGTVLSAAMRSRQLGKHRVGPEGTNGRNSSGHLSNWDIGDRRFVLVTARQHPGEANSSWILEGFLRWAAGDSEEATLLRENVVLKIVPMLNPDGVVNGNYRMSLAGVDLNRNWRWPSQERHPTVFYTKALLRKLRGTKRLMLYLDLHGHSRKTDVFFYGGIRHWAKIRRKCRSNGQVLDVVTAVSAEARSAAAQTAATGDTEADQPDKERGDDVDAGSDDVRRELHPLLFPNLLHQLNPAYFSFRKSRFAMSKTKRNTARVVARDLMNIVHSFTLESSFHAFNDGASIFKAKDWLQVGAELGRGVLHFYNMVFGGTPEQTAADANRILFSQDSNILAEIDSDSGVGSDSDLSDDDEAAHVNPSQQAKNKGTHHWNRPRTFSPKRLKKRKEVKRKGLRHWKNRQGKFKAEQAERREAREKENARRQAEQSPPIDSSFGPQPNFHDDLCKPREMAQEKRSSSRRRRRKHLKTRRHHKRRDKNSRRSKSLPAGVKLTKKLDNDACEDDSHNLSGQSDGSNAQSCSGGTSDSDELESTFQDPSVKTCANKAVGASKAHAARNSSTRQDLYRKIQAWCTSILCEMYFDESVRQGTVSADAQKSYAMVREWIRHRNVGNSRANDAFFDHSAQPTSEKFNSGCGRISGDAQRVANTQLQEADCRQLASFAIGSKTQMRDQVCITEGTRLTLADYLQSRGLSQSVRYAASTGNSISCSNDTEQAVGISRNCLVGDHQSSCAIVGSPSRVAAAMRRLRALDVRRQDSSSASSESPPVSDTESGLEPDADTDTVANSGAPQGSTSKLQAHSDDAHAGTGDKKVLPSATHQGELDNNRVGRLGADSKRQGLNLGFSSFL